MPLGRLLLRWAALITAAAAATSAAAGSHSAPDQFPLGESAQSGAVCQAVRDDEDPAGQVRGGRAWSVRCRGWDNALGRLYAYSYKGAPQIQAGGHWGNALDSHAVCEKKTATIMRGVTDAKKALCRAFSVKVPYVAYSGLSHGRAVAAEGFVQISDVL
jgi:hypothetical protein